MIKSLLSWSAFSLYSAASVAALYYLMTKNERASRLMLTLIGCGLALQFMAFGIHLAAFWAYPENRWFLPINNFFGALSYMSFALAGAFFAIEVRRRLGILGAFVLPMAALSLGFAVILADPELAPLAPKLRSYWLNIHPMILMTAYATFTNAFGVALALLIQERQIKSRKPSELCYRLPSLDELDELNGRIITVTLPILVLGLVMGSVWSYQSSGHAWSGNAKEIMSLVTAGFYGEFLWLRYVSASAAASPSTSPWRLRLHTPDLLRRRGFLRQPRLPGGR